MVRAEFLFTPDHVNDIEQVITPALRGNDQVDFSITVDNEALTVAVTADTYARLQGAANSALNTVKLADKLVNS